MSCHYSGRPPPALKWLHGTSLIGDQSRLDSASTFAAAATVLSDIHLHLNRTDHNTTITCQATNSDLAPLLNASIQVHLISEL